MLATESQPQEDVVELNQYSFDNLLDRFRFFNNMLTAPPANLRAFLRTYVNAGSQMFLCNSGFIGQRIGGVVRVVVSESDLDNLYDGQLLQVNDPLIANILPSTATGVQESVTNASFKTLNLSYNGRSVQNVLAVPLYVHGDVFGLICFFASDTNPRQYSPEDQESIELMAKGVAKMIELQSTYKDQKSEKSGYATPGVKHFDDYLLQARLPEVYGVAGKVVEVLKKRVGHAPLGIGDIAAELSLSKRTLQRRLQQQDLSYAEIRDKVRFHYSIDYLIEQNASIDSISSALDFSDRTSFTNAFKRWTGLSPSAFRKLFRDYA